MPSPRLVPALISALAAVIPLPTLASSADAWAAHRQQVAAGCLRASVLVDARLAWAA